MKKLLVLVLLMVFLSGCIFGRPVKVEANNGLKINEFSADPSEAEYNDPVFFSVDIENVGGTTANNIDVTLYGIENIWRGSESPTKQLGSMSPPELLYNTPGDLEIETWTYEPPILPEGVKTNLEVTARVKYDYSTTGTLSIPVYSKSYARINQDIDKTITVTNTNAPIQIELSQGTGVIVDGSLTGNEDHTLILKFVNVGDGWPISAGQVGRFLQGTITIQGAGATFTKCLDATSGNTAHIQNVDYAKFRTNGELPIGCSISIPRSGWGVTTTGNILLTIDMEYTYYIEKKASVMVHGTKQPGGSAYTTTTTDGGNGGATGCTGSASYQLPVGCTASKEQDLDPDAYNGVEFPCELAYDNNEQTAWFSGCEPLNQYVWFDLGAEKCINAVQANIPNLAGSSSDIEIRVQVGTGTSWKDVVQVWSPNPGFGVIVQFPETVTRYVRLLFNEVKQGLPLCENPDYGYAGVSEIQFSTRDYTP